jgi:large subunit ribosomal protein L9
MKVILLQNVKNVGQKGEVKEVSEGFARNNLIPRGLAKAGTEKNLNQAKKLSGDKIKHNQVVKKKTQQVFEKISNQNFVFTVNANEVGSLFAKFDSEILLKELHAKGFKEIQSKHLTIPEGTIKEIGEYTAVLKDGNITSTFSFTIKNK